jgi:hypothetical protein
MRLGDDPQLFFHAPTSAAFPPVDDLDRVVRHDFKEHLKVDFKVYNSPCTPGPSKAVITGRLRCSGFKLAFGKPDGEAQSDELSIA